MRRNKTALRFVPMAAFVALGLVAILYFPAHGGNPTGAEYSTDNNRIFWFVHFSDIHIGTSGSQDSGNLNWLLTNGRSAIAPEFMVATGDLTDSTNGNALGIFFGPYQAEWNEYKAIVDGAGAGPGFYYDLPGNHDAYSDRYFAYYLANSVQGRATGNTQVSWTREFPFGKYHFLGVNSADNTGNPFSLSWPWGDYAGLDATELAFINTSLNENSDAALTMVFGHHPVTDTGVGDDTWLYYGHQEFIQALDTRGASLYGYGHTHRYSDVQFAGNSYTGTMYGGGVRYLNIASIGKDSSFHYDVVAVDCNGVSSVSANVGQWPVVLITAPVAKSLGATPNPYSYTVPAASGNPIRALVFDEGAVSSVRYRIDGGAVWYPMSQVAGNTRLYEGLWDASALAAGDHAIEVQAVGSSTRSHAITVAVTAGGPANTAPVANGQSVTVQKNIAKAIALTASDAEGDPLTYAVLSGPTQGALTGSAPDLTYTPAAGYLGDDSFTFKVNDGSLDSDAAAVSITVVNNAPAANDDAYATDQGQALTVSAPGVLANDTDLNGDPLTAVMGSSPIKGSVTLHPDGSFIYTPDAGVSGTDSFTYTASDGTAVSAPALVLITVNATGPETVIILTASYSAKAKKLHVEATSSLQPDAVLTVVGYGDMTWTAAENKYIFDKRVSTAPGDSVTVTSNKGASDTFFFGGTSNTPPVANSQSVTVLKDTPTAITLTASDADGNPLTYTVLSGPAHGSLSGTAPNLTYTPATGYLGPDSFTFKVNDGQADSAIATVSIQVAATLEEQVRVLSAEYKTKTRQLTVHATSSLQPNVTMELLGYGPMTYDANLQRYVFSKKVSTAPGPVVTVRSSTEVTATGEVIVK